MAFRSPVIKLLAAILIVFLRCFFLTTLAADGSESELFLNGLTGHPCSNLKNESVFQTDTTGAAGKPPGLRDAQHVVSKKMMVDDFLERFHKQNCFNFTQAYATALPLIVMNCKKECKCV